MDFRRQYLTYDEYLGLGGRLDQTPFNILEFEARNSVDKYTFGRLKELPEQTQEVKMCVYKLINTINNAKENSGKASESIDGYSVSYFDAKETESKNKEIVKSYLVDCKLEDGTPYLYAGAK